MYGSQRSLQSVGLVVEGRAGREQQQQQQPQRPMSTSPPPYSDHHNVTDSDIYGRIGMTRHVQVGQTLPAGFGRHQRGYSSLPPSRRQSFEQQQQQQQLVQQQDKQQLSRRSSVASYTAGTESRSLRRSAASNPSTPEKVLDKKEKSSKKEKEKDKEKKKKEAKTEKSPKKKWFWTLPLRRKKKNKEENTDDDDGGFKSASQKGPRKNVPADDSSFIRYPSPDTGSSDMNSSYSSEVSGEHSYRSSPSAEVYYYSRRAQQQSLQQHQLQQQQLQQLQQQQLQQQQQQQQQQASVGVGPRSLPTTPVSPPDGIQSGFVPVNSATQNVSEETDLAVGDPRGRRYMSREELYAAMRHPQYYNYHRGSMTSPSVDYGNQNSTPTSSRSQSPAVFGVSPLPSYTVRPQVQNTYGAWPPDHQVPQQQISSAVRESPLLYQSIPSTQDEDESPTEVEPPVAYQNSSNETSIKHEPPKSGQQTANKSIGTQQTQQNQGSSSPQPQQQTQQAKQTTRVDFKKMLLNKSMSSAGGNQRISAVEMLRASRPSIYGYSPPPAPVVKPPQPSPQQHRSEGVIMPPTSRNTARALLFQSRFGSGRRFRTPKTEIISTTILEDHGGETFEEDEEEDEEEEEEEDEEEDDDSSAGSPPERRNVQGVRGPLARAYSEPCRSQTIVSDSPSASPVEHTDEVAHSTPNTTLDQPPQPPDVSMITSDVTQEDEQPRTPKGNITKDEKESMETAL